MITRRTVVHGAAWSVPVILAAVAVPLVAASTIPAQRIPLDCTNVDGMWHVPYNDGTTEILTNGQVNSDKTLQALCRSKGPRS